MQAWALLATAMVAMVAMVAMGGAEEVQLQVRHEGQKLHAVSLLLPLSANPTRSILLPVAIGRSARTSDAGDHADLSAMGRARTLQHDTHRHEVDLSLSSSTTLQ